MWWVVGVFGFAIVVCRVMLASKWIDRFLASRKVESEFPAKQGQSGNAYEHGRILPFRKRG